MQHLDLAGLHLHGTLPEAFSTFTNMQHLDIRDNLFEGTLPRVWASMTNLTTLDASLSSPHSDIKIQSSLPSEWEGLSKLQLLDLSNQWIYGEPSFCFMMPSLFESDKSSGPSAFVWFVWKSFNFRTLSTCSFENPPTPSFTTNDQV